MIQYKLTGPVVIIEQTSKRTRISQLASGSVLRVPEPHQKDGIVQALCQNRLVGVYAEDIRERAVELAPRKLGT